MYNTSFSDSITQLYASIEEFDGDIDRLISDWDNLYPSVRDQLETKNELDLMNGFAEILFHNGKLDLATSVDENIQEILEADAASEIDEENRDRFYSLINGRWSSQANSPTATNFGDSQDSTTFMFSREDEIPRSYTPIPISILSRYNTALLSRDEIPRSCAPKANPTPGPLQGVESSERTTYERFIPAPESPRRIYTTIQIGGTIHEKTALAPLLGQTHEPSLGSKQYAP